MLKSITKAEILIRSFIHKRQPEIIQPLKGAA